jgi:hypothetical protein
MLLLLDSRAETKGMVVIFEDGKGGTGLHGYESVAEAAADLLEVVRVLFAANGCTLRVMTEDGVYL